MRSSSKWLGVLPLLVAMSAAVAVSGCSHKTGQLKPNQAPFVKITGGPLMGSNAPYTARVYWTGWDNDGIVDHYEYALDPPSVFSQEEIRNPEAFPGTINIRIIPGPAVKEDTLVVSKTVDGQNYSFEWIQTTQFSRSFAFQTPNADSVFQGSLKKPLEQFSGVHLVYVRCQDNDKAFSATDYLGYTAETQTPKATISRPNITGSDITVGPTITVAWDGVDPDSPDPKKKPTGYIYRMLNLSTLHPFVSILHATPDVLFRQDGVDSVWTYQKADTLQKTFFLSTGDNYVFGIRAVDIAGGVEPIMEFGRNSFKFQSQAQAGSPKLTITEPSLGSFNFSGFATPAPADVPVGAQLRFKWTASAEGYGGTIDGYSWGVDIPDLDREGPGSGWSGWGSITNNFTPIVYTGPGVHVLYVRARDVSGTITLGSIILNVIDFPLDREILFVDDSYDATFPRDSENDAFWKSLFDDSGRFSATEFFKFESHGPDDRLSQFPAPPPLPDMGRYRLQVWDVRAGGTGGVALTKETAIDKHLGAYLNAGGKVWISGTETVAAMLPVGSGIPDFNYPHTVDPGTFPWDFLKLYTTKIDNDKGSSKNNSLLAVRPFPFPASDTLRYNMPPVYPRMDMDSTKVSPFQGAVAFCDAIFDPIYTSGHLTDGYPPRSVLDSLYVSVTVGAVIGRSSSYEKRLDGLRWHNPDPARIQGRVQWFGFPMYFWKKGQAQEVFNRSIDWFREEQPPTVTNQ